MKKRFLTIAAALFAVGLMASSAMAGGGHSGYESGAGASSMVNGGSFVAASGNSWGVAGTVAGVTSTSSVDCRCGQSATTTSMGGSASGVETGGNAQGDAGSYFEGGSYSYDDSWGSGHGHVSPPPMNGPSGEF